MSTASLIWLWTCGGCGIYRTESMNSDFRCRFDAGISLKSELQLESTHHVVDLTLANIDVWLLSITAVGVNVATKSDWGGNQCSLSHVVTCHLAMGVVTLLFEDDPVPVPIWLQRKSFRSIWNVSSVCWLYTPRFRVELSSEYGIVPESSNSCYN